MNTTLPTDSQARKNIPLWSGCVRYFIAALAGVARISKIGNEKHNPGEPMHHARGKSDDHTDCVMRHMADAEDLIAAYERCYVAEIDPDALRLAILDEADQAAWRVLAWSQELHERFGDAPLAPGARRNIRPEARRVCR